MPASTVYSNIHDDMGWATLTTTISMATITPPPPPLPPSPQPRPRPPPLPPPHRHHHDHHHYHRHRHQQRQLILRSTSSPTTASSTTTAITTTTTDGDISVHPAQRLRYARSVPDRGPSFNGHPLAEGVPNLVGYEHHRLPRGHGNYHFCVASFFLLCCLSFFLFFVTSYFLVSVFCCCRTKSCIFFRAFVVTLTANRDCMFFFSPLFIARSHFM